MPLGTPIELTLYDDNDEIIGIYRRARIPMTFAERAMDLSVQLTDDKGPDQLKAMYQLIVEFFGEKFTVEDLRKGADLLELITVVEAISVRAGGLLPANQNPFPKGSKSRPKRIKIKKDGAA